LLKFGVEILFCKHYFSPHNTIMRKGAQKHKDPADPDPIPDPGYALKAKLRGLRGSKWSRGRSKWRLGGSKWSPGGSVDKFSQIRITSTRTNDPNSY
jgi:hypothetical protein